MPIRIMHVANKRVREEFSIASMVHAHGQPYAGLRPAGIPVLSAR
jgi:hypothetical protein